MKLRQSLLALITITSLGASGAVFADPSVTVTFKNIGDSGSADAVYTPTSSEEVSTSANASPKPASSVKAGGSDTYTVNDTTATSASPSSAVVRYTIGSKTCVFHTSYSLMSFFGGNTSPQWGSGADASGGATCQAIVTSTNYSTRAWAVDFTMK